MRAAGAFMVSGHIRPLTEADLDQLPEGWRVSDFARCVSDAGKIGKVRKAEYLDHGRYAVIDQSQELIAGYWDGEEDVYTGELPVIVFGDHTRVLKYVNTPFVAGADGVKIIAPNPAVCEPGFLYYALLATDVPARGYNRHYSLLRETRIPCPPLPEQQAIAHVLRTVQEAIEATERVIAATKELKRSLMRHLFTYGPVPVQEVDRVPLKETEIGSVPEHWRLVKMSEVAEVRTSFPSFGEIAEMDTGDDSDCRVLALKVSDLNLPGNARYVTDANGEFRYPWKAIRASSRFLKPGSVVFPKRGAAIATNKKRLTRHCAILDPNLIGVEPSSGIEAEYILAFLDQLDLASIQDNTTIPQLNKRHVAGIVLPLPSGEERSTLIGSSQAVERKLGAEHTQHQVLQALFASLLHNLMTGKVRVSEFASPETQEVM